MEYNNIETILKEFDFTDSIIIDIHAEKFLAKVSLLIDYYWDIQEGKNKTRILEMAFTGCTKLVNNITPNIVKDIELGNNVYSFFTIVSFEKKTNNCIAFYNGIGNDSIIEIEFEKVEIFEKKHPES